MSVQDKSADLSEREIDQIVIAQADDDSAWEEPIHKVAADNAQWDALLATDAAQTLLQILATEALAEQRAGRTRPMAFDDDGRIVPG